jgi:hypothetical protein
MDDKQKQAKLLLKQVNWVQGMVQYFESKGRSDLVRDTLREAIKYLQACLRIEEQIHRGDFRETDWNDGLGNGT